jgi:HAD superfamily hydrolase (TIGR01549 family)
MFVRRCLTGEVATAYKELKLMRRHRNEIETARKQLGKLPAPVRTSEVREIEKRWYEAAIQQTGPANGVREVISLLESIGIPQVIVSDYEAGYKLESLGIENRFAAVYVGEDLGFVKPGPQLLQRVAADFRLPVNRILHLGDRVDTDEAAARAAGCQCLILGRDFLSFDVLLEELRTKPTRADRTAET